jgi:hypothetical protein
MATYRPELTWNARWRIGHPVLVVAESANLNTNHRLLFILILKVHAISLF